MATHEYKLPDPGEGLTEAEIVSWHVAVGDTVKVNDIVCEVETAKSIVELPTPYAGTVTALLVPEGETVAVGTPIIAVADGADEPAAAAPPPAEERAETGAELPSDGDGHEPVATLVGYGPRERQTVRRRRRTDAAPAAPPAAEPAATAHAAVVAEPAAPAPDAPAPADDRPVRTLAKPPVRKLAKDLGIDLRDVPPSEGGVVRRPDVEAYAKRITPVQPGEPTPLAAPTPVPAPASGDRDTRIPVKGVRKATAEAMVASAFTAPHVTEWLTVDVTRSMELLDRMRADRALADVKVSPLLLVVRAVCLALRRTPEMNATYEDASHEIVLKGDVHLGIAAATPRGLLVPVVRDADRLAMPDLAARIGEVVATAREGRTQPADLAGGTFSITNVGVFGIDAGTPILVPGQTGILAFGAINRRPWVVDEEIVPRWVTTLAVSFDHRVVDGEQGSRFLADVGRLLEDPASALAL